MDKDFLNYLVATGGLDEFLGLEENEDEQLDEKIEE